MIYLPSLKTTDAELRAVQNLSPDVKKRICPIFELTRSRKTKKDPQGSLLKRLEQVKQIYGNSEAVIDLTTEDSLINAEMDALFDEVNGYAPWCYFAESSFEPDYIPCLQYSEGSQLENFKRQARRLRGRFQKVALRVSVTDIEAAELYQAAVEEVGPESLILIANVYFIESGMLGYFENLCSDFIKNVIGNRIPTVICFPASGFPKSVGSGDYGQDGEGVFPALENALYFTLSKRFPSLPLIYADFGSVHPKRYETAFGTWIPRVDVPFDGQYSYTRVRRHEGGYVAAARSAMSKFGNKMIDCWGSEQVRLAAAGKPMGSNPSFWISVRVNMWITQQVAKLGEIAPI